jgi:hypothetical protein
MVSSTRLLLVDPPSPSPTFGIKRPMSVKTSVYTIIILLPSSSSRQNWLEAELFGPGHFVGLGLRLKTEIRTRTRART